MTAMCRISRSWSIQKELSTDLEQTAHRQKFLNLKKKFFCFTFGSPSWVGSPGGKKKVFHGMTALV
jgi:hypothetical protein